MKTHLPILLLASLCAVPADARDKVADSVVKVYSTLREPSYFRPWTKESAREVSGTGVIVEGRRILTNAHVVNHSSQIFVQANQTTERVPATVKSIAPAIDMAIIDVENPDFYEKRPPLPLADKLPAMKQSVSVYGYPIGGEELSITQGVVSRIECASVTYGNSAVRIQIDAAVNPGNSGGPAVADGKLIGLVYSKFSSGENIGYLLAAEEARTFLQTIRHGPYLGKPQLRDVMATTENAALRARLGLKKEGGLMVVEPESDKPDYPLKRWDVVLKIGDHEIDSNGFSKVRDDLRLSCQYFVPKLTRDGRVRLSVWRDRKAIDVDLPVRDHKDYVMPPLLDKYPRYFIYGPMVFTQVTQELAGAMAAYSGAVLRTSLYRSPLAPRLFEPPAFSDEEIVALAALLKHKTSKGYSPPSVSVVARLDGTKVRNLAHLVQLLRDARGEFLTVEFVGPAEPLVFRRAEVLAATEEILADEGIRKQYSDDLETVWHKSSKAK